MQDDITQAFADLNPEDFFRVTSAIEHHHYLPTAKYLGTGATNFDGFVDAHTQHATERTLSHEGFQAVSYLHSLDELRKFAPDNDETAPQYAARLAREAKLMQATWFWTGMIAPGRATDPAQATKTFDADNMVAVQAGLEAGVLKLAICWCAANIETVPTSRRSGLIFLDEEDRAINAIEGALNGQNNFFHAVLGTDD